MNPFNIVFALVIIVFISTGVFSVVAPSFSVSLPVAPTFPTIGTSAAGDWLGAAYNVLLFVGQIIWFLGSYISYFLSIVGVMFSILTIGVLPPLVGTLGGVLLMILFIGSVLMFIRGYGDSGGK